ncbi:hypothetical protein QQ008_09640 [Fulvivirgaceae bacterium BMA10]|uniref:STAS/SEC14 domain-containing protein n=1 Tax=Splendidivirga corallicola TaxID=3051826 RepID=A0ABT8KLM9_9BACT|nr:hypothetical protein [Fulvivirgaceae bacterium BMA10]
MKELFNEEYLECHFDKSSSIVYHIWKRDPTSEQFRSGLLRVYNLYGELSKDHGYLHWLADTQHLTVVSLEDQKWLDETWNELLFVEGGVKSHAVIVGDDVFAKYAMNKFKIAMQEKYADQEIQLETFTDEQSAYDWFASLSIS